MQAILLLAHKGIDYITEFCKQFNNDIDFQIYIHQDIKNKISERDIENLKRQFTNIKYFCSEIDGKYSDISLVNSELILICEALKDNPTYCHLMSEQCYLTVTLDKFKAYFENNDKEYIWICDMLTTISDKNVPNSWRLINKKYRFYGSQWWSLTGKILNEIIKHPALNNYIQENIEYCNNPENDSHKQAIDETFFQSFIMHYGLYNKYNVTLPHHRDNQSLRFVDWSVRYADDKEGTHPGILGIDDNIIESQYKRICKLNHLIIRKIDYKQESSLNILKAAQKYFNNIYMSNSDVTVCMCTRNRAKLMLPSIKCILNQTYKNFDLLIVNDASEDDTEEMLKKLIYYDERIKYITLDKHDFINARNTAFINANTKYIAIMDSDDKCSPDKLAAQVKYLDEHPDIDVVGCKIKFGKKTQHLSIPKSRQDWDNEYFQEEIKNENISMLLHFPSIMIRKSTLDRIFPNGIYFYPELKNGGEDQIFLYTMYLNGAKFANVSEPTYLYNYLEYDDAISASIGKHFNEDNFIFKYIHNKPFDEKLKVVNDLYTKYIRTK